MSEIGDIDDLRKLLSISKRTKFLSTCEVEYKKIHGLL